MMIDEYTFVTLDNDTLTTGDALFVDIDEQANMEMDFVHIDDAFSMVETDGMADFIMLDDIGMIGDMDIDSYSSDISEIDVSIIL